MKSKITFSIIATLTILLNIGNSLSTQASSPHVRQINFKEFCEKYTTTDNSSKTYKFREAFEVYIPKSEDAQTEINVLFPSELTRKEQPLKLFKWNESDKCWLLQKNIRVGKESFNDLNYRTVSLSSSGIYAVFEDYKTTGSICLHSPRGYDLLSATITQFNLKVKYKGRNNYKENKLTVKTNSMSILADLEITLETNRTNENVDIEFKFGQLKNWQIWIDKKNNTHIFLRKKDLENFHKTLEN